MNGIKNDTINIFQIECSFCNGWGLEGGSPDATSICKYCSGRCLVPTTLGEQILDLIKRNKTIIFCDDEPSVL